MTDKFKNGLIDKYEYHLARFKDKPITLVELGIFGGESLDYFATYFTHPKTRIIGVDVKLPEKRKDKRIEMIEADQRDTSLGQLGEVDVIIDDASHVAEYTKITFENLWNNVKPGGYYVIEDWHGSFLRDMEDLIIEIMRSGKACALYKTNEPLGAIAFFRKERQ